jgi:hypothetical protein
MPQLAADPNVDFRTRHYRLPFSSRSGVSLQCSFSRNIAK